MKCVSNNIYYTLYTNQSKYARRIRSHTHSPVLKTKSNDLVVDAENVNSLIDAFLILRGEKKSRSLEKIRSYVIFDSNMAFDWYT